MAWYIVGLVLGVIAFVLQNLKPTSSSFRVMFLILTVAFLWGISYANLGFWHILIIPIGVLVLCFISAMCFPYMGKSSISEYSAVNGRDYYAELRGDDKIGRIDAPGFRQTYDRIIVGIVREITSSEDDLMRFGKLLYSKNFYPISCHTKKEIMQHINTVIEKTASSSNDGDAIREKARNRIEFLFNAYVSVMSIHEEATRNIEELKQSEE